uniref:ORF5 n=1 Tax=Nitrosopumilaceae spindle-shaped virus TaxID=3065433 RepID=A0AAT9J7J9_9VIRU
MPCIHCGCNREWHEYQRDGGSHSGDCTNPDCKAGEHFYDSGRKIR